MMCVYPGGGVLLYGNKYTRIASFIVFAYLPSGVAGSACSSKEGRPHRGGWWLATLLLDRGEYVLDVRHCYDDCRDDEQVRGVVNHLLFARMCGVWCVRVCVVSMI